MDKTKIWPGKITTGCRQEPTEIACIWVTKIYDACSQKECEEFYFEDLSFPKGAESFTIECSIQPCSETFYDWSIEPIDEGPLGIVRVRVCAILQITIRDAEDSTNYTTNYEEICFLKEVILYAPDPIHMQVLVESIFESLTCEIVEENNATEVNCPVVIATVGAFIVVKTALQVQLLVPAFGFCPTPPECEELGDVCEQFLERPFPPFFPPQLNDLDD